MTNEEAETILRKFYSLDDTENEALDIAIKALKNEPMTEEKAIDHLRSTGWLQEHDRVLTEPKKGKWIIVESEPDAPFELDFVKCPFCDTVHLGKHKFCSFCGAKMIEEVER